MSCDATGSCMRTNLRRRRVLPGCAGLVLALVSISSGANPHTPDGCAPAGQRVAYAERSFLGYECEEPACEAHKAGFAWADRWGITDPLACDTAGLAGFEQGCRAFAEDTVTAEQSGFEWARENEVADDCLCGGAGPRFQAGCDAYVSGFGSRAGER